MIFEGNEYMYRLQSSASIFTAELYAIHQALNLIMSSQKTSFLISTDSLSSIQSIRNQFTTHPMASDIQETLTRLFSQGKNVMFVWTPSHCGLSGNEQADISAKRAASLDNCPVPLQLHSDVILYIKMKLNQVWQQHWEQQNTKLNQLRTDTTYKPIPACRRDGIILRRLRIGHSLLTHKYLLERQDRPVCEICDVHLSIEHVLSECPKYVPEKVQVNLDLNLSDILDIKTDKVNKLMVFLKMTELYNLI